jgi:phosphoglycolate phosphatase
MPGIPHPVRAILFDLDGTLVDTAPDLGLALNLLRAEHGLAPVSADQIRPQASHGARGLLALGFDIHPGDPRFDPLRQRLLLHYSENLCRDSRLFPGIPELLDSFARHALPWGVVTNKPARFTEPLMSLLELSEKAACIVSGDTCAEPKPHPGPLLHACKLIDVEPQHCLYIGDAERDIQAAQRAAMPALVAAWGYIAHTDQPGTWGALALLDQPAALLNYLN